MQQQQKSTKHKNCSSGAPEDNPKCERYDSEIDVCWTDADDIDVGDADDNVCRTLPASEGTVDLSKHTGTFVKSEEDQNSSVYEAGVKMENPPKESIRQQENNISEAVKSQHIPDHDTGPQQHKETITSPHHKLEMSSFPQNIPENITTPQHRPEKEKTSRHNPFSIANLLQLNEKR